MAKRVCMSGNEAVAYALKQINPDVIPAFPITPSTEIPENFVKYISSGEVDTEFIPVESEHSAMSAAIGAEAAGARTVTATSSCGLALMWEELYVAASDRLPVLLTLVNRALSGPININCDHSDSMGARDSGWLQIYAENNQEVYDNAVMAYRIAEHADVRLPIMICQDGFITSHGLANMMLLEDKEVKDFVGEYEPKNYLLNEKQPMAVGPYAVSNYYMESKRGQIQGMINAKQVILDVAKEFEAMSGRKYGFFEEYCLEDAEYAIVIMGSAAGTAKDAIDKLRSEGKKVGLLKIRVFRPFPAEEIAEALRHVKAVGIMDRAESFSTHGGPLASEVVSGFYRAGLKSKVQDYMYGIGGRDIRVENFEQIFAELETGSAVNEDGTSYCYVGLRR